LKDPKGKEKGRMPEEMVVSRRKGGRGALE